MNRRFKASTIVETLLASVIVMTAFACILLLFGSLTRRTALSNTYIEMKQSRDSLLKEITSNGLSGEMSLSAEWGHMTVRVITANGNCTELEIVSTMLNGMAYRQNYLISNEE